MVFLAGLVSALALGVGYVLQQRVAARVAVGELLTVRLLFDLVRERLWWWGIAAMVVGQAFGAWAFALGSVALVEPLLTVSLLVTFVLAAGLARHAPRWQEVLGTLLLCAALGVFLAVSGPTTAEHPEVGLGPVTLGSAISVAIAVGLVVVARRRSLAMEAVLIATAAGVLYGLQDVGTRGALVALDDGGIGAVTGSPWPYVVVAAGAFGVILAQNAFGAARLDYSLPPSAATEPVVGIALGLALLGDTLPVTVLGLLVDALCLVALVGGVVLIGSSPAVRALRH